MRELVGSQVKIVCSLDLHGNLGDAMTEYFDAMVGYRLYPHEDQYETGHKVRSGGFMHATRHFPRTNCLVRIDCA